MSTTFPSETDEFVDSLAECNSKVTSDVDCITRVRDGLNDAKQFIQKVRLERAVSLALYISVGENVTVLCLTFKIAQKTL